MDTFQEKLNKIVERLKSETASLRTGRATPALIEEVSVDCYGTPMPLKSVAAISSPEARQLVIQPWDQSTIPAIEKALQDSSVGLSPVTDQHVIRINIPALTEERRKELTKLLGRYVEEARIKVRQERDAAQKKLEAEATSEDEEFRGKKDIQKQVDDINKRIEDMEDAKEKEIMTV